MSTLGKALFIVNPAAQSGNGARGAARIRYAARQFPSLADSIEIATTKAPRHATEIAAASADFDTVVALGGDGIVHEVFGGLMRIPVSSRPSFALIPCGNGNDYARTLGMSVDFDTSFGQLALAKPCGLDVGVCNGEPFAQTLSFGLDAAIALGTHDRRERKGYTGTRLFVEEGVSQLLFHRDVYSYEASFDDGSRAESGSMYLFAVQIGPSYGGGFRVCPNAVAYDGACDICIAHPPLSLPRAAKIFMKAKNGHHLKYTDVLSFESCSSLHLEFDAEPPAQIDGESIGGTVFDVSLEKQALSVMLPVGSPAAPSDMVWD